MTCSQCSPYCSTKWFWVILWYMQISEKSNITWYFPIRFETREVTTIFTLLSLIIREVLLLFWPPECFIVNSILVHWLSYFDIGDNQNYIEKTLTTCQLSSYKVLKASGSQLCFGKNIHFSIYINDVGIMNLSLQHAVLSYVKVGNGQQSNKTILFRIPTVYSWGYIRQEWGTKYSTTSKYRMTLHHFIRYNF